MKEEKIRKFADKQGTIKQTKNSTTEATLILCGYSGERANYKCPHISWFWSSIVTADKKIKLKEQLLGKWNQELIVKHPCKVDRYSYFK